MGDDEHWEAYSYTFTIDRSWKGVTENTVTLITGLGRGDCGVLFEIGRPYLVYAHGDGSLETNICTRTAALTDAQNDLAQLGAPETTFVPIRRSSLPMYLTVAIVALIVCAVLGSKWQSRTKKREKVH